MKPVRNAGRSLGLFFCVLTYSAACQAENIVRLATTRAMQATGFLEHVVPSIDTQLGISVQVIAVDKRRVLDMGRKGDVDIILLNSQKDEEEFVAEGYSQSRNVILYSDLVLLGPQEDPAGVGGLPKVVDALRKIKSGRHTFVSRGDGSDVHLQELAIWQSASLEPDGHWYVTTRRTTEGTLEIAGDIGAYVIADRSAWMPRRGRVPLKILVQNDRSLFNYFALLTLSPERFSGVNNEGAGKIVRWFTSSVGKQHIADFTIDGIQVFKPAQ